MMSKLQRLTHLLGLVGLAVASAACEDEGTVAGVDGGADGAPVACPSGTGNGTVTLTVNAPAAITPSVEISGGGLAAPVTLTTATPATLPAGTYTIRARRVKAAAGAGELIGKAYYGSNVAFDGCVRAAAATSATVTYAQEPGSNKAWVTPANGAGAVLAFDEAQLRAGGAQLPTVTRQMGITAVGDLAFDLEGNLWVADRGVGGGILAYPMLSLGTAADQRPALKIPGLEDIRSMVFDAEGNLWAAQLVPGGMDRILKFPAAMLSLAGTTAGTTSMRPVSPTVMLTSADMDGPFDIALDAAGNLWVAANDKDAVIKFGAAQLATGGMVGAQVILKGRLTNADGTTRYMFPGPTDLVFDSSGQLWVTWGAPLARLTPANLMTSGMIDNPLILEPQGMGGAGVSTGPATFDAQGGLVFSRTNIGGDAALVRITAAQIAAGGEPTTLDMSSSALGNGVSQIVLNPVPTGLPIRD